MWEIRSCRKKHDTLHAFSEIFKVEFWKNREKCQIPDIHIQSGIFFTVYQNPHLSALKGHAMCLHFFNPGAMYSRYVWVGAVLPGPEMVFRPVDIRSWANLEKFGQFHKNINEASAKCSIRN
jgi:hypothetical protein